jgi:hypothetical protein
MLIDAVYWSTRPRSRLIEAGPSQRRLSSSSDPQLKIRLIGEVKRTDETVEHKGRPGDQRFLVSFCASRNSSTDLAAHHWSKLELRRYSNRCYGSAAYNITPA